MDLLTVLKSVFPEGDVLQRADCPFEVTNLKRGTQPVNCKVLRSASEPTPPGYRREHFIVEAAGALLSFRICSGSLTQGSEEYVVGAAWAHTPGAKRSFTHRELMRIAHLCPEMAVGLRAPRSRRVRHK